METVSRRKAQAHRDMGMDTIEQAQNTLAEEEERRRKQQEWQDEIKESFSYKLCKGLAVAMDTFCLDPIMGLFPVVGDVVSSIGVLPYLYITIYKVRSFPLTLAVLYNALIDIMIGLIPVLGDFCDIFVRSYRKNARMITGYVEGDQKVIRQVKGSVAKICFLMLLVIVIIYYLCRFALWIGHWIAGLF